MSAAVSLPLLPAPGRLQRLAARAVGSPLFWSVFVASAFAFPLVRSVRRQLPSPPPVVAQLPAFQLVDQLGRPVTEETLRGRVVIAELVTPPRSGISGATPSGFPPAPSGFASPLDQLQKRVRNTGGAVLLVSFVSAPEDEARQTAERLASEVHPGATRWLLAAGDTAGLTDALGTALGYSPEHRLLLLDGQLRLRRAVLPKPEEVDLLMRDIGLLANSLDKG